MKKFLLILLSLLTALVLSTIVSFAVESPQDTTRHSTDFLSDHEFSHNLNMNSTTVRFESGETISILCGLNFDDSIQSYQASESGLHITSAAISDDEINVSLSFDTNALLHEIEIQCVTAHSESVSLCIYAIQTDRGIFISPISYQEAQVNYLADMFAENEITWEECEILLSQLYQTGSFDLTTLLQPASGSIGGENEITSNVSASISGTLQWYDEYYIGDPGDTPEQHLHPIRRTLIKLFRTGGLFAISETISENDGTFEFHFNANTDYTYYVRVYTGDQNAKVCNEVLFDDYYYDYHADIPVSFNASHAAVCDFVATMGNADNSYFTQTQASGTMGRAFQISQAILYARDFADLMMGSNSPSDMRVVYPHTPTGSEGEAFYRRSEKKIRIAGVNSGDPKNYASWDMLMHEYGHHISHELGTIDTIASGYNHAWNENTIDTHGKQIGSALAWKEAWPTIFGAIAQQKYNNILTNIRTIGDNRYDAYNFSSGFSYENGCKTLGEGCESSIMAILWDIFDDTESEIVGPFNGTNIEDKIHLSYQQWWNITTISGTYTFSDFANHFYSTYPQYKENFNQLLTYYKMASWPHAINLDDLQTIPTFSWNPQGGSTTYPNNRFDLYVEKTNGTLLFSKTGLTTPSYTPTTAEANLLLSDYENGFQWYVSATQVDTTGNADTTGPYISAMQAEVLPPLTELTVATSVIDTITSDTPYRWYRFTSPIPGNFTFYTTYTDSSLDTIGQLFNTPVFGTSTSGMIASNDDGGSAHNFSITQYILGIHTVYLRVKSYASATGSYELHVKCEHTHEYNLDCTNYDATYHRGFCSCGASQLVAHNWMQVGAHRWQCVDCGRTTYTDPLSLNLPEGLPEIPDAILPKAEWARAVS